MQIGISNNVGFYGLNLTKSPLKSHGKTEIYRKFSDEVSIEIAVKTRQLLGLPANASYAEVVAKQAENRAKYFTLKNK